MAAVEIDRTYRWQPEKMQAVVDAFAALVQEVTGNADGLGGEIVRQSEPDVKEQLDHANDMIPIAAALSRFRLHPATYVDDVQIGLNLYDAGGGLNLRVTVPKDRKPHAIQAVERFQMAAGVVAHDQDRSPVFQTSLKRRYDASKVSPAALLDLFMAHLVPVTGATGIEATLRYEGRTMRLQTEAALRAELGTDFKEMDVRTINSTHQPERLSLWLTRGRRTVAEIQVDTDATRQAQAEAAIAAFQTGIGSAPLPELEGEPDLRGVEITGFTQDAPQAQWLADLVAAVQNEEPESRWFSGRIDFLGESGQHTFGDVALLLAMVRPRWSEVLIIDASFYGRSLTVFVHVEPKLALVRLEVKAADEQLARAAIDRLTKALGLTPHAREVYGQATVSRTWRIRNFDREAFAAVMLGVVGDYVSKDPIVWQNVSYVAEADASGAWAYERFNTLEPLVARVRNTRPFVECRLTAAGPWDRFLSLAVLDNQSVFEASARLSPGVFADVCTALEKRLSIESGGREQAPAVNRTLLQQAWALEGIVGKAIVGAVAMIFALVGFGVDRLTRVDTLTMISPMNISGTATVTPGCVPIEWEVRGRALFDDGRTLLQETGTLQVDNGEGRRIATIPGFRSGEQLRFSTGSWSVYVHDPVRQRRSGTVIINVQDTSATATADPTLANAPPTLCPAGR